jgi:4,5-dihydroxyphthalate decarboxylase
MGALRASFVPSPLTKAMIDGTARPRGVELDVEDNTGKTTAQIIEENSKRMVALELDVAEMSFGTFTRARDLNVPILALPVYPGRRYLQPAIVVRADSDIQEPDDLRGKRAAIGQFWMTAFCWHRVILNTRYDVQQSEISWVCTQPERWDRLPKPQAEVTLDTSGREPLELLKAGEVDVALLSNANGLRGDGRVEGVRRLFPEPAKTQLEYYKETGIFPIIHLVVMRAELAQDQKLYDDVAEALGESKRLGLDEMIETPAEAPVFGGKPEEIRATFGADPYPYGIDANRTALETFLEDAHDHQHLTERQLRVEDLIPAHALARR